MGDNADQWLGQMCSFPIDYNDDIKLFYEMMDLLENNNILTIIMPGNHDFNNNISSFGLINLE